MDVRAPPSDQDFAPATWQGPCPWLLRLSSCRLQVCLEMSAGTPAAARAGRRCRRRCGTSLAQHARLFYETHLRHRKQLLSRCFWCVAISARSCSFAAIAMARL
mmetsp:Transcript_17305/g.48612  ORF Transcript_17305/g.48612 Transcript_17305/m.48612 type:complete len:104 (+) Transcript_17305:623-934(+)